MELTHEQGLERLQRLASATKWKRLLHHPAKYLTAILHRKALYPFTNKALYRHAQLFWGTEMYIALPAATDIFLTGGKSHDSEIRLARWLMQTLKPSDHFLDIGAHYGYFSLLAASLLGSQGKVLCFEPSSKNFLLLAHNVANHPSMEAVNEAVSDKQETVHFFEFPNRFSEYSSMDTGQFQREKWFQRHQPVEKSVRATTIDRLIVTYDIQPSVVKIDVEGAENKVISGAQQFLRQNQPYIVLEFLPDIRSNKAHQQAARLLKELNYLPHAITPDGSLHLIDDAAEYLRAGQLDSDNIVFRKA